MCGNSVRTCGQVLVDSAQLRGLSYQDEGDRAARSVVSQRAREVCQALGSLDLGHFLGVDCVCVWRIFRTQE